MPITKSMPSEQIQLIVTINGETWTRVESFRDSQPDDTHYVAKIDEGGNAVITFGDGKRGRRPEAGSHITATYRFGSGRQGNTRKKRRKICLSLG